MAWYQNAICWDMLFTAIHCPVVEWQSSHPCLRYVAYYLLAIASRDVVVLIAFREVIPLLAYLGSSRPGGFRFFSHQTSHPPSSLRWRSSSLGQEERQKNHDQFTTLRCSGVFSRGRHVTPQHHRHTWQSTKSTHCCKAQHPPYVAYRTCKICCSLWEDRRQTDQLLNTQNISLHVS